jgi:small subunit ribosomal protein S1
MEDISTLAGDNSKMKANTMEQLLDDYGSGRLKRGQVVNGEIIRVENEAVFVDVGSKRDAYVPRKDIDRLDDEFIANMNSGDLVPVEIDHVPVGDGDLIASISKGLEQKDWEYAEECLKDGEVLSLEVVDWNRGGLLVEFGELGGFVPNSHLADLLLSSSREESEKRKEMKIGTKLSLKVIEVNREKNRLILSEKAVDHELRSQKLEELDVGQIVSCKVQNIVDYGVFVDLGGITGLIHVSELAWKRVKHPKDLYSFGDQVHAKVINVDVERERVKLSCKALMPNPWDTIEEQHQVGDWVEGYITGIKDYGAFVKLPSGFEGLIHISEIKNGAEVSPHEFFRLNEEVRVRILHIDPELERISLSLTDVESDDMESGTA